MLIEVLEQILHFLVLIVLYSISSYHKNLWRRYWRWPIAYLWLIYIPTGKHPTALEGNPLMWDHLQELLDVSQKGISTWRYI